MESAKLNPSIKWEGRTHAIVQITKNNIDFCMKYEKKVTNSGWKRVLHFLTIEFFVICYEYQFYPFGVASVAGGGKSRSTRERYQSLF